MEGDLCPGRRHADDLRQRTEPGQGPARRIRGKEWIRVCSHHVQAREALKGDCLGRPVGGLAPPQRVRITPNPAKAFGVKRKSSPRTRGEMIRLTPFLQGTGACRRAEWIRRSQWQL